MLNVYGLNRKKAVLMRLADKNDPKVNEILQDAVKKLNRVIEERTPSDTSQSAG